MASRSTQGGESGFSLIELLVVLAIVAILGVAGASVIGNRGGNSVRVVLDELEGAIMDAHKYAASTGRDVAIVTWGAWDPTATAPASLLVARGAASQTSTDIQKVALDMLKPVPVMPTTDPAKSVATLFVPSLGRDYMNAGVVVTGSPFWTNAMQATSDGKKNDDLMTVAPFTTEASFQAAVASTSNLFTGALNQTIISGANKRFNSSFMIQVVSTAGGFAVPGGAMGVIVVLNNGATVYKFYNSGVRNGDGRWRRI
jgi:prepilin-type N-terminal cleavage/methylation domain-containing protein